MRIGIDAREICGRSTGVGRYLSGLLGEWSRSARAHPHEFVLYVPATPALRLDTRQFAIRVVAGKAGTWWEQIAAPRVAARDHLDVWFAPAYSAPLSLAVPVALVVHDLSFFAHPEWFTIREGLRRRWLTRESVARAAVVITISQFSKRELMERLDVPETKIALVPPGISCPLPSALSPDRWPSGGEAPAASPRILYVGSIFTRRHVPDLIHAFAPIARAHVGAALDIVGDNRTYPREDVRQVIASEQLEKQVSWHEYLDDDRLRDRYAAAGAFAFLSEYEGLGLTPLEALAAGVPPVLLDTAVARESCGSAAVYVARNDRTMITKALERALFDEETRAAVLNAAGPTLARYDWSRAADDTLREIERASG
jgi:glycosyltransferase involved in cell wall biosynthesis